jgi:hypothetical protein
MTLHKSHFIHRHISIQRVLLIHKYTRLQWKITSQLFLFQTLEKTYWIKNRWTWKTFPQSWVAWRRVLVLLLIQSVQWKDSIIYVHLILIFESLVSEMYDWTATSLIKWFFLYKWLYIITERSYGSCWCWGSTYLSEGFNHCTSHG